jgi:aryl-alcohol dehydrogenase-like predicted oxidoreductase
MQSRSLGQSGIQASAIGLGTWAIGGAWWGGTDEQDSISAIQAGIDAGITLVDTAPMYGQGLSEELVGRAIKERRDRVVLATKCGLIWWDTKGDHFFDRDGLTVHRYLGPESIQKEVEDSLRRLQTDVIDLYQTHWQETTTPIADTMAKLLELKDQGKIRAIGVSNVEVRHLDEYRAVGAVDSAQEKYSMLDRKLEDAVLPYCREHDIAILAYSPMELGLLSGKMTPGREFEGDDLRKDNPKFTDENINKVNVMLKEFEPIARDHDLTIAQLVNAWTFHQPGITHVLVGSRNPGQARENAKAGEAKLSPDELKTMSEIIDKHRPGLA